MILSVKIKKTKQQKNTLVILMATYLIIIVSLSKSVIWDQTSTTGQTSTQSSPKSNYHTTMEAP